MKIIENLEMDFRKIGMYEERYAVRVNGDLEFVRRIFFDDWRSLTKFRCIRREGDRIIESSYSLDPKTGIPHLDRVGEVNAFSLGYSELSTFLEACEATITKGESLAH